MLLIVLDWVFSNPETFWISPRIARQLYSLSPDTWAKATRELERLNLVNVERAPVAEEFGWRRTRKKYSYISERLNTTPSWHGVSTQERLRILGLADDQLPFE